jgi:hypothetical protein
MNRRKIIEETTSEEKAFNFSIALGLIRNLNQFDCTNCASKMNFEHGKTRHAINGRFRCARRSCRKTQSIFAGTVFCGGKVSFKKFFDLLYCYCEKKTILETKNETGVSRKTVCFWNNKFDEIILDLGRNFLDLKIGGANHVVEVDEALLFKRQANVGRVLFGKDFGFFG